MIREERKGGNKKGKEERRKKGKGEEKMSTHESNPEPSALQPLSLPLSHCLRVELHVPYNVLQISIFMIRS